MSLNANPGARRRQVSAPPGRDPENHKIRCFSQRGSEASPERPRGAEVGSKATPGAKREAQSSLLGASGEVFWGKIRDSGPLRKHQYLLGFNHILRVRAPPCSPPKPAWERDGRRDRSFSHFFARLGRHLGARGAPQGPKGAPRPPRGPLKINEQKHLEPSLAPLGCPGRPGGGYPPQK